MKQLKTLRQGDKSNNSPDKFRGELKNLLIEEIEEVENVRTQYPEESIKELAESIEQHGLLHPIVVIKHRTDEETDRTIYRVIAGHRRLRAYRLLLSQDKPTYSQIKAIVRFSIGDIETNQLIENVHREDLSPSDLEKAVKSIMEREGLKQTELAKRIGKSKDWVSNSLIAKNIREDFLKSGVDATLPENFPSSTLSDFSGIKDKETRNKAIKKTLESGGTQKKAREIIRETKGLTPAVNPSQTSQKAPGEERNAKTGDNKGENKTPETAFKNDYEKQYNRLLSIIEKHIVKYPNGKGIKELREQIELVKSMFK